MCQLGLKLCTYMYMYSAGLEALAIVVDVYVPAGLEALHIHVYICIQLGLKLLQ